MNELKSKMNENMLELHERGDKIQKVQDNAELLKIKSEEFARNV